MKSGKSDVRSSEVLERARELIERGWCQGGFTPGVTTVTEVNPEADAFCVQGAIVAALKERGVDVRNYSLWGSGPMNYMEAQIPEEPSEVWNDDPKREKGEVLDLLDHAIKQAKEDESLGR